MKFLFTTFAFFFITNQAFAESSLVDRKTKNSIQLQCVDETCKQFTFVEKTKEGIVPLGAKKFSKSELPQVMNILLNNLIFYEKRSDPYAASNYYWYVTTLAAPTVVLLGITVPIMVVSFIVEASREGVKVVKVLLNESSKELKIRKFFATHNSISKIKHANYRLIKEQVAHLATIENESSSLACGLAGSVEERVKSCNLTVGNFSLVTKTLSGNEVYQDNITKVIWSDRKKENVDWNFSYNKCKGMMDEIGNMIDLDWMLPSPKDFILGTDHGMLSSLPNMNHWFWTNEEASMNRHVVFGGATGISFKFLNLGYPQTYRCIAKF